MRFWFLYLKDANRIQHNIYFILYDIIIIVENIPCYLSL